MKITDEQAEHMRKRAIEATQWASSLNRKALLDRVYELCGYVDTLTAVWWTNHTPKSD